MKTLVRLEKRKGRRIHRVRNGLRRSKRLRLSIFRSNKHIYAQIIDDQAGRTLVSASSVEADLFAAGQDAGTVAAAEKIGKLIAERAIDKGLKEVVFDRAGYRYHGRVKALAAAARAGGLEF